MNAQHSSKSDCWYTPSDIIYLAQVVLDGIDLDPASDAEANTIVQAKQYFTKEDDSLSRPWHGNVWLNPPGGKIDGKSAPKLFWEKLMAECEAERINHAIFLGFSLEQLLTTQKCDGLSMLDFPMCVPSSRIRFLEPGLTVGGSPSHGNVIVYVPGRVDSTFRFENAFKRVGKVKL